MTHAGKVEETTGPSSPSFGRCSVCGGWETFHKQHKSIREGYKCSKCGASLRYRHQATVIVSKYAAVRSGSFAELAREPYFQDISIYEPGIIGPFRKYLKDHPNYVSSYLWEGVEAGDAYKGVGCENLESLTFGNDSFDLVITSDIFEHIRKPYAAFEEIYRVLKPGGNHVFTVPQTYPLQEQTVSRVDTLGAEDSFVLPAIYHGSPTDSQGSLVYTDFGLDLVEDLANIGFETEVYRSIRDNITFCSEKK